MCGKPKQLLVISGDVEEGILEAVWQDIVQEYAQLIQTDKSATVFEAYKKMVGAKWKMEFVEAALRLMRAQYEAFEEGLIEAADRHNATLAEKIMLLGYNHIQDTEDPEEYYRALDGVEMESRALVVFFNQYKAEYEAVAPKGESKAEERDRMSYGKELALLSKFMESRIDPETITVLDYAAIVNFYLESHKKDK